LAGSEECTIERGLTDHIEQLDLMVWTKPFPVDSERFSLFAVMDISERRRREALERIFLHDLMNTAGSLSSLMNLIDPKESSYDEYFALARGAADQLVEELVSHRLLADAEAGSLPAELTLVAVDEVVASVADLYRRIAESRGVACQIQVEGNRPIMLTTDAVLLKRVLSNLCKNAVEASARGQSVSLVCRDRADAVEMSVWNSSLISEEVRSQLFRRSFSTKGRGRGIGTYAARLFVEDYLGGSITVSSDPEAGTVFTVRIPRKD
jgi:signal transduction histidine kinase